MTAAVYRSGTPSLALPQTQNTAPVLEFNCLYTHDIRRKQKRWQDGFLRFHTFNKRVMVYDIPRNYIGDTHWKSGDELQDGDEVTLEREGVLVQVAESIGRTETDLTELRKSTKKGSSEAGSSPMKAARAPAPSIGKAVTATATSTAQLRHRSLNTLLGTPKGQIGKAALPTKSPFEERYQQSENRQLDAERPSKRARVDQSNAWNIARAPNHNPAKKEAPLRASNPNTKQKAPEPGQKRLGTGEVIDLSSEADDQNGFMSGFSSDALAPSSPHKQCPETKKSGPVQSSSPAFQRQATPESAPRRSSSNKTTSPLKHRRVPDREAKPRPPDFEVYVDRQLPERQSRGTAQQDQPERHETQQRASKPDTRIEEPARTSSGSGKKLRMSASAPKKKTLLCQEQVSKKPTRVHSKNTENAIDVLLDVASQDFEPEDRQQAKTQRRQLQERLERIRKKGAGTRHNAPIQRDDATITPAEASNRRANSPGGAQAPPEDRATELAKLDRMIMPPQRQPSPQIPPPERQQSPDILPAPQPQERQLRRVGSEANIARSGTGKRIPGAPVRYTPSPAKRSPTPAAQLEAAAPSKQPLAAPALPSKTKTKKAMQRATSLNITSNGTSTVILSRPLQAPKAPAPVPKSPVVEKAPDPWSREAFDLFTWRPPGWDEDKWCLKAVDAPADMTA